MRLLTVMVFLTIGCSHAKKEADAIQGKEFKDDRPAAEDLSSVQPEAAQLLAALPGFTDPSGYLAGRLSAKTPATEDTGDGALVTGISMLAMSCDQGAPYLVTLVKAISDNKGMIPRHNPLVASDNGPTTRDQVTGVALAFVDRWQRCPGDQPAIKAAWAQHVGYVNAQGALGPTSDGDLLTFKWLWGAVGQYFGAGGGGGSKPEFEAGLVTTAASIKAQKSACYPAHIGTLQAVLAEKIGQPMSWLGRGSFCEAASGLHLPLTEWYCERQTAADWLGDFQPNVWAIASQRCPGWEGPDGAGKLWPGADFLEEYGLAGSP